MSAWEIGAVPRPSLRCPGTGVSRHVSTCHDPEENTVQVHERGRGSGRRRTIVPLLALASVGSILLTACGSSSGSNASSTSAAGSAAGGATSAAGGATSAAGGSSAAGGGKATTITVAVVDNPQMVNIEKLTPAGFTAKHPNIKVKFVTLDENTLR